MRTAMISNISFFIITIHYIPQFTEFNSEVDPLEEISGRDLSAVMFNRLCRGHIRVGVFHIVPMFRNGEIKFQLRFVPEFILKFRLFRNAADRLPDLKKPGFHCIKPGYVGTLFLQRR